MFQPHPSERLTAAFRAKPYQGAKPEDAQLIFVGLDANYAPDIERNTHIFERVLDYHHDGVAFWRKWGVHHPFLLPGYGKGGGQPYHRSFAKIGLGPADAHRVSFFELMHVPTVGVNRLNEDDLDTGHLRRLAELIESGAPRQVFLSDAVIRLLQKTKPFGWLRQPTSEGSLPRVHTSGNTTVYKHLHFSYYGPQASRKKEEAQAIAAIAAATA